MSSINKQRAADVAIYRLKNHHLHPISFGRAMATVPEHSIQKDRKDMIATILTAEEAPIQLDSNDSIAPRRIGKNQTRGRRQDSFFKSGSRLFCPGCLFYNKLLKHLLTSSILYL